MTANAHLSWDTINDYADDALTPDERSVAAAHLDRCTECRAGLEELRRFLGGLTSVPREADPPEESWPVLRAELERRKVVGMPGSAARGGGWSAVPTRLRWGLAAAAVLLVAASSGVTAVILRGNQSSSITASAPVAATAADAFVTEVAQVERGYLDSVVELTQALEAARPRLAPATVAVVERNLAVIDAAIIEARAALLRDPGNRDLLDVLAVSYRQKLDLLRRAAAL